MPRVFNLVDTSFAHDVGATAGRPPSGWIWDRSRSNADIATFYTHECIFQARGGNCYAMLFESKAIIPDVYRMAPTVLDRFVKVFTHDSDLLGRFPDKCLFIPGGGIWIGGPYGLGDIKIYPKTKLVSMVSSKKLMCPLHKFRLDAALALQAVEGIDVFIGGGGHGVQSWVPIINSLADYMYSIVVENFVDDFYFTEKILNCFAAGTIPIYLGARRIGDFFDERGIIQVSNWSELVACLPTLSEEDYYRRSEAIIKNHHRCQLYKGIEDYMDLKYGSILPAHVLE